MKKTNYFLSLVLVMFVLSSCTHRITDFTVISTKNFPISSENPVALKKADKRVEGVDKVHVIIGIPTGTPNLKQAIDRAIESYPGAVGLADGVVKSTGWSCLLYGQSGFIIEGTPIYEIQAQGKTDAPGNYVEASSANQAGGETMVLIHKVKAGETLMSIAQNYGVTARDLIKWNMLDSSDVEPGTRLKILVK